MAAASPPPAMWRPMKLTHLQIHKYRDVAPGTRLVFSPRFNLVLGENGTGRTALLDLLALVLGSDFSGLIGEELSLEYGMAIAGVEVRVAVRNERAADTLGAPAREGSALLALRGAEPPVTLLPSIELRLELLVPATRVVIRADGSNVSAEVDGQRVYSQSIRWSLLERSVWVVLFLTAQYLAPDLKERLQPLLNRTFLLAPARFDEGLGMFDQLASLRFAMQLKGSEVFPLGLMALPTWLPGRLRDWAERQPSASIFELHHLDAPRAFLAKFVALAGFAAGTFRVELLEKQVFEDGARLEFGRFGFLFARIDGSVVSQAHLGYGQKRLLSFLYYLDLNGDFAVADELANGLGPRWVEACMRELGSRQAFLTTQNPLVFEHVPLQSAEDFRSSLILCEARLRDGRERPVWSNPSPELAARLFTELQAGPTPLGVLLRALQIW
jgi:hypothetical protein